MELKTTDTTQIFHLLCFCILISIAKVQATSHKLTCSSLTHKLKPGSTIVCQCQVDITRSGNSGALWNRIYGNIRQNIGKSHLVNFNFKSKRYSLSFEKSNKFLAVYKLEIKDVRVYDGVTIHCVSHISKKLTSQNTYKMAVCDNVNSTFCNCMLKKGWASPKCREEKLEADRHAESLRRACIVIGLLMALMLVAALVVTIRMLHRDIRNYIEDKRDERLRQQEVEENHTRNTKTPSQSILKRTINHGSTDANSFVKTTNQQEISVEKTAQPKDVSFSSNDSNVSYNHERLEKEAADTTPPTSPPNTFAQRPTQDPNTHPNFKMNYNASNNNPDFASFNNFIQNSTAPSQSSVAVDNNQRDSEVVMKKPSKNAKRNSSKKKPKRQKMQNQPQLYTQHLADAQQINNGTDI